MSALVRGVHTCSNTFFSLLIIFSLSGFRVSSVSTPRLTRPELRSSGMPLNFELNEGQTHERVKFLARSNGYVLFLTATEAVMAFDNPAVHRKGKENRDPRENSDFEATQKKGRPRRAVVRMKLEGANPAPQIEGLDQLPATSNYFAGSDPAAWR